MHNLKIYSILATLLMLTTEGCKIPAAVQREANISAPETFSGVTDTTNVAAFRPEQFFSDPNLVALIDTGIARNQELSIALQEIEIARNEALAKRAPLSPAVSLKAGAGLEKVGEFTSDGAGDKSTEITPGRIVPENLPDYSVGFYANWEVDIWKKLHNASAAAALRVLSTQEGRKFVITNLVAEIAGSYYELQSLDNQLEIVRQNISLQQSALDIVKVQKDAARTTELAVQKFNAEVFKTRSLEFNLTQRINATENKINFLLARFPQPIPRTKQNIFTQALPSVAAGVPSQLLGNRPDIRQAEFDLAAAKLDVKAARAEFLPSFGITAAAGLGAFNPRYLIRMPESVLYSLVGDLSAPLVNRRVIKAEYASANARQMQSVINYERAILNAFIETTTELSNIDNLQKSFQLKSQQVDALTRSIEVSNDLFRSARADYLEVLMTQRDVLEAKLEMVETRRDQLNATVAVYRDLGGGWR